MEQVLVVERHWLEAQLGGRVFTSEGMDEIAQAIVKQHHFAPRESAEYDASLKQIIPYVVIRQAGCYYVLRRLRKQTEARLHDKLSLGVGGHINPGEQGAGSVLEAGMHRELAEEVHVERIEALRCVGILNETTGGVSDYHAAIVYLLDAGGTVEVAETEKMAGQWMTLAQLEECLPQLETWSALVLEHLLRKLPQTKE